MDDDRNTLVAARELYERAQARPFIARTRCEVALMDRDRSELDRGLDDLELIGDVVQVERYLKRWSSRGS